MPKRLKKDGACGSGTGLCSGKSTRSGDPRVTRMLAPESWRTETEELTMMAEWAGWLLKRGWTIREIVKRKILDVGLTRAERLELVRAWEARKGGVRGKS